jgi:ABC-type spermidine/putrescine transport system permease subunit I
MDDRSAQEALQSILLAFPYAYTLSKKHTTQPTLALLLNLTSYTRLEVI